MRYGFYLPTRGPTATRGGILALALTRLSGGWNAICRAEAGPPRPGL